MRDYRSAGDALVLDSRPAKHKISVSADTPTADHIPKGKWAWQALQACLCVT